MDLVGLFCWKNCVELGYLPAESFLSLYPALDRAIICVDPSGEDTLDLAYHLQEQYHFTEVFETPWRSDTSLNGEAIGDASNEALSHVSKGDWVFNLQADEIVSPQLLEVIKTGWRTWAKSCDFVSFKYLHTLYNAQFIQGDAGYDHAWKLALNDGALKFEADAWGFWLSNTRTVLCHEQPIVHLHHFFKDQYIGQLKNSFKLFTAGWTEDKMRAELARLTALKNEPYWENTTSPFGVYLTKEVKRHLGKSCYNIPND